MTRKEDLQFILGTITQPEYDPTALLLEEEREIDTIRPSKLAKVLEEV